MTELQREWLRRTQHNPFQTTSRVADKKATRPEKQPEDEKRHWLFKKRR